MIRNMLAKYKLLVFSIALFLIFDLGVLILNFYTSGEIAKQTERIDLAARQRTMTQQMSKATLYIKAQKLQSWPYQTGLSEIRDDYMIFGQTLDALTHGGEVISTKTDETITIPAVQDSRARGILDEANQLWAGYKNALSPLMVDLLITDEEIVPASTFIAKNDQKMFDIMNRLTIRFKELSDKKTTLLRTIQIIGISLATINFFVILFHFLKQLRTRESQLELAKHESDQILDTIDEGVLLVDRNMRMGSQYSRHMEELFYTNKIPGRSFKKFLRHYLPKKTVTTALEYAKLFFSKHVSADLVDDINPLQQIKANIEDAEGNLHEKYLNFSFARMRQEDDDEALLVTIKDVTDAVMLSEQQQASNDSYNQQIETLTEILPIDPQDLNLYTQNCSKAFERMNAMLKKDTLRSDRYISTLQNLFKEAHGVKGEASTLGIRSSIRHLEGFEDDIEAMLKRNDLNGRDFLPLTIQLKELIEANENIISVKERLSAYNQNQVKANNNVITVTDEDYQLSNKPEVYRPWRKLIRYTQETANELGKNATLTLRGFENHLSSTTAEALRTVSMQLIQNSLVHGIEGRHERSSSCKPDSAQISITLSSNGNGNYRYIFEDDGRGFDFGKIKSRLVEQHLVDQAEVDKLSNQQLIRWLFREGFSTAEEKSSEAGRGVGLSLVWSKIRNIGGNLKVRSISNENSQFIVDFKDTGSNEIAVA